jgi:hypothetical protein
MPPPYPRIPSPQEWQSDSSVTLAIRNNDSTLRRIDNLIEQYEHNEGNTPAAAFRRHCLVCDMFFTVDYWLKTYRSDFSMASGRADTVNALYRCIVDLMCGADMFNCPVNILPNMLDAMFGRSFSADAVRVDVKDSAAEYMTQAMAHKSKLVFKNGIVYGYRWERGGEQDLQVVPTNKLVRLNSADLANPGVHADSAPGFSRFAFFVMSMSRDLYMRQHYSATLKPIPYAATNLNPGIYHSSYLGATGVSFAGSMLVENGIIRAIRNDSGHFQPIDSNYVALLWALQMYGVSIDPIWLFDYTGWKVTKARHFLNVNGDWEKLVSSYEQTSLDNMRVLTPAAAAARDAREAAVAAAAAPLGGAGAAAPAAAPAPGSVYNQYQAGRPPGPANAAGPPPVYDAYEAVMRQLPHQGAAAAVAAAPGSAASSTPRVRGPYDVYVPRGG